MDRKTVQYMPARKILAGLIDKAEKKKRKFMITETLRVIAILQLTVDRLKRELASHRKD
ncbi:hypothetical protein ACJMK2_035956 [Sinanodonta woodiana]|uniref:Uncharacterized protein n=1 Tax=Sinanodonta woodiana TaxID=1069815 RepID=A0ABD3WJ43_SINWO